MAISITIKMLLNCFACHDQSDWPKRIITVFIVSLSIHDIKSLTYDRREFPQILVGDLIWTKLNEL
jgi:hypothetical protein